MERRKGGEDRGGRGRKCSVKTMPLCSVINWCSVTHCPVTHLPDTNQGSPTSIEDCGAWGSQGESAEWPLAQVWCVYLLSSSRWLSQNGGPQGIEDPLECSWMSAQDTLVLLLHIN